MNGKAKPPEDLSAWVARWVDRTGCQVAVPNTRSKWVGEKKMGEKLWMERMTSLRWKSRTTRERKEGARRLEGFYLRVLLQ